MTAKRIAVLIAGFLGAAWLSGCGALQIEHVRPWQRDVLSRPGMQVDPEPLIDGGDDHLYFSREASKGGRNFGGGGCGCN